MTLDKLRFSITTSPRRKHRTKLANHTGIEILRLEADDMPLNDVAEIALAPVGMICSDGRTLYAEINK